MLGQENDDHGAAAAAAAAARKRFIKRARQFAAGPV